MVRRCREEAFREAVEQIEAANDLCMAAVVEVPL